MGGIKQEKWSWKMGYCKENKIPPAQKWAWEKAEEAQNELKINSYEKENHKDTDLPGETNCDPR